MKKCPRCGLEQVNVMQPVADLMQCAIGTLFRQAHTDNLMRQMRELTAASERRRQEAKR